jgi:hypothetical protein
MCSMGGGGDGGAAAAARAAEEQRQANAQAAIERVNTQFAGFNDDFFRGRETAYSTYAMPQLDDQYGKAREDLFHALQRSGLTNSSVAGQRLAELERDFGLRKQEITDQARSVGQQARSDVEASRASLIGQAQSTADASLTGNQAMAESQRLTAAPSFSPLGQIFANAAAGIGVARNAADTEAMRRGTGARTYQPTAGSARVVN